LLDPDWVLAMQEELNNFKRNEVWTLVLGLGVRVYPKFRVGFFRFFIFRVSNSRTRTRTQTFGYPQFREPAISGLGKIRVPVTINHTQEYKTSI
jgi:hypothetical protein